MAAKVPTFKYIAWISLIPHLLFLFLFVYIFQLLEFKDSFVFGAAAYLLLSYGLRTVISKDHREGINLIKEGEFEAAIACFEKSYHFFSRNSWIDKYRYVTLFSASKMSYKEMALCNIAFCYSQVNEGFKAIEYYERTLQEFPENGLAKTGLKMLNSVQQIEKKEE